MSRKYKEEIIRKEYASLTRLLIDKGLTITTMESATAGQIASLITDTEGSSQILKGAFITYCNEAKIMQGVPATIIEKYSVYSEETAREMAKACAKAYKANIGIGVTGTMGNIDPENESDSVPGQVYFAIYYKSKDGEDESISSYKVEIAALSSRLMYKLAVAKEIYIKLMALNFLL